MKLTAKRDGLIPPHGAAKLPSDTNPKGAGRPEEAISKAALPGVLPSVFPRVDTYNRFRDAATAEGLTVKDWIVQVAERSLRDGGGDV